MHLPVAAAGAAQGARSMGIIEELPQRLGERSWLASHAEPESTV